MEELFLFFDTETTGLPANYEAPVSDSANWPRLVQLAWIITDSKGVRLRQTERLIKPEGFTIPADAIEVHGITNQRALKEGKDLVSVLIDFYEDVDIVQNVVGHNISFDRSIVGAEFYRAEIYNAFDTKTQYCTKEAGTQVCKIPKPDGNGYKWPSLKDLHTYLFGEYFDGAHSALADTRATERCFWEMRKMGVI